MCNYYHCRNLTYFCSIVAGLTTTLLNFSPKLAHGNLLFDAISVANFALSIATTVLSTIIIVYRILRVARMPGASHRSYVVIEILVESAALYSASLLADVLFFTLASEAFFDTYSEYLDLLVVNMAVSIQCSVLYRKPCLLIEAFTEFCAGSNYVASCFRSSST
jgi:hypothetical protein